MVDDRSMATPSMRRRDPGLDDVVVPEQLWWLLAMAVVTWMGAATAFVQFTISAGISMSEVSSALCLIAAANEVLLGLLSVTRWRVFHWLLAVLFALTGLTASLPYGFAHRSSTGTIPFDERSASTGHHTVVTATEAGVRDCCGRQLRQRLPCPQMIAMTDVRPVAQPLANCDSAAAAIVLTAQPSASDDRNRPVARPISPRLVIDRSLCSTE